MPDWAERAAGQPVPPLFAPELGKDHDFTAVVAADAAAEIDRLRTEWQLGDAAVKNLKFSDTFDWQGGTWSLRMTYVHLIGEYARHNGHADLLREAIDGVRGR